MSLPRYFSQARARRQEFVAEDAGGGVATAAVQGLSQATDIIGGSLQREAAAAEQIEKQARIADLRLEYKRSEVDHLRTMDGDPNTYVDRAREFGQSWEQRLQEEDPTVAAEVGNFVKFNLGSTEQRALKMATTARVKQAGGSLTTALDEARRGFLEADDPDEQELFFAGAVDAIEARRAIIGDDDAAKQRADLQQFAESSIAEKTARRDPAAYLQSYEAGEADHLGKYADSVARLARAEQRRRRFEAEDTLEAHDAEDGAAFMERQQSVEAEVYSPNRLTPDFLRENQNALSGPAFARANASANAPAGRRNPAIAARLLRERASGDAVTQALARGEIDDADAALIEAADDVAAPITDLSRPEWLRSSEAEALDELRAFMTENPDAPRADLAAFARETLAAKAQLRASDVVRQFRRGERSAEQEAALLVQRVANREISRAGAIEQMRRLQQLRQAQEIIANG
ncbi:MAG: hypothetical protein AAF205_00275 [Pseudomonadota bacterium]